MGFSTDCIHAGQEPEPHTGAVTIPIYQTSTYVQPKLGEHKGYEYARTKNPTRSALEANMAALERGKHGHAFASGMSAIDVVFRTLQSGDHVVAAGALDPAALPEDGDRVRGEAQPPPTATGGDDTSGELPVQFD